MNAVCLGMAIMHDDTLTEQRLLQFELRCDIRFITGN